MFVGLTYNLKKDPPAVGSRFDDRDAEWDDQKTIDAVIDALSIRHTVVPVEADENAFARLTHSRPEIVFNIAEGEHGPHREAYIPSILEMLNIPYTGSDPTTLGICLDKGRTKEILRCYKIPTPDFFIAQNNDHAEKWPFFPAVVKPLWEGSSKGIRNSSLVKDRKELESEISRISEAYRQPAIVEKYLPGREFTAAVIGNGNNASALPLVEICFDSLPAHANRIYSFEAKWMWDIPSKPLEIFDCPARINTELEQNIKDTALMAYHALRCRDWCRIDIRLDENGTPNILEVNPLPGILPNPKDNSCFPKAARAAGIGYPELINRILDIAEKRIYMARIAPAWI